MEETKNLELGSGQEQEEKSAIDFQLIYSTLILNCIPFEFEIKPRFAAF